MINGSIGTRNKDFRKFYSRLTWAWSASAVALAFVAYMPMPIGAQLLILAVGVALFGVPHGGLDHVVGERLFGLSTRGTRWSAYGAFFVAYTGLALLVLTAWWLAPKLMLILFLVASAIHFGLRDGVLDSSAHTYWHVIRAAVFGAMPIVVPWLMFPAEVATVFGWLSFTPAKTWMIRVDQTIALAILALLAMAGVAAVLLSERSGRGRLEASVEIVCTIVIFAAAPPLLAFAWYFCFLHSPRHMLTLAHRLRVDGCGASLRWVLVRTLPLTLMTVIAAVVSFRFMNTASGVDDVAQAAARVIFWGLAALTFPHMLLTAMWERREKATLAASTASAVH